MWKFFSKRKSSNYPAHKILLYGLQRSGTNYLETLVKLNFENIEFTNGELRSSITHKHFRLYDEKEKIPEPQFANQIGTKDFSSFESALPAGAIPDFYLIISKDPASWLSSYTRWSIKNKWPEMAHHYLDEYQLFYARWMEFAKQTNRIIFIRYDQLLSDPKKILNTVGAYIHQTVPDPVRTAKKVYASRTFTKKKKKAFLNREHLDVPDAINREVEQYVSSDLRVFLGYT